MLGPFFYRNLILYSSFPIMTIKSSGLFDSETAIGNLE